MPSFYFSSIELIFKELTSSANGLSDTEALNRLKRDGKNELSVKSGLSVGRIFLNQFLNPLVYILLIASWISLFLQEYLESTVIFATLIINALIGFLQEYQANKILKKLKSLVEYKTIVRRDGRELLINSSDLVIGDIILIKAGDKLPADGRLIKIQNLQINESALTGESLPIEKNLKQVAIGCALPDRLNMVYAGTIVSFGKGEAIVCAIGEKTEIGKIAQAVSYQDEEKTPLQKRLEDFSKLIGIFVLFICFLVFIIGTWQGRNFLEMFLTAVSIAAAAIPEGLVAAITVILILGMRKIFQEKALVRKLLATETLGSITTICSDKTGTITEGKMQVAHLFLGFKPFDLPLALFKETKKELKEESHALLLLKISLLCNETFIENPQDELKEWRIIGSPTESALFLASIQAGLSKEDILKQEKLIAELPFDSAQKYMISLYQRVKNKNQYELYEKGAPEKILTKCRYLFDQGKLKKLTLKEIKKIIALEENLTQQGLRVIGLAARELNANQIKLNFKKQEKIVWQELDQDLVFVGLIALKDPLRSNIKETINFCRDFGIKPILITGDHKLTVQAIAIEAGFFENKKAIITGEELDKIEDSRLKKIINKIQVFARVSPHHKLRIVRALQANNEIVAMTGDGVNDAPALKAANIGIALGGGTDIAREASDLVLLDNNFKTIVTAIKEGKLIFDKMRKVITYLLADSFSETILIIGSLIANLPLAILPIQILWINLINDGLSSFALSFEKGDSNNTNFKIQKSLKANEPLLNRQMISIILGAGLGRDLIVLVVYYWLLKQGVEINYLRTLIFAILIVNSISFIFSLRDLNQPAWKINFFSNKTLLLIMTINLSLLYLSIYWSPMQTILNSQALYFRDWGYIALIGFASFLIVEFVKYLFYSQKLIQIKKLGK